MASSTPFATLLLSIWLFMAFPLCFSESRRLHFRDEARPLILLDEFGFTKIGGLDVRISHFSHSSPSHQPHPDLYQAGFFLWPRKSLTRLIQQFNNREIECPLHMDGMEGPPLTFRYLTGGKSEIAMGRLVYEDEHYALLYANCVDGMNVSMDVQSAMFNFVGDAFFGLRNYLSVGEKPLPTIYFLLCSAYFALTMLWTHLLLIGYKKRHVVSRVHVLILIALILKAINLYCESEKFSNIKRDGFLVNRFKIVFYVLRSLTESTIFVLTVSISTAGILSLLRPFSLPNKGKKMVFFFIIPLQIIGNIARFVADEAGPFDNDRFIWMVVFLVSDLACCFAWLVINDWSFKDLHQSQKVIEINSEKFLETLNKYFAVVKVYVFLTRVVLFAWDSTTVNMISYRHLWTTVVASEFVTLAFYVFMGLTFRPGRVNKYDCSSQIDEKMEEGEAEPVTKKMVK